MTSSAVKPVTSPEQTLKAFFAQLGRSSHRTLLLDYDGTLAPFHIEPSKALPYPGVRQRLDAIMADPRNHVVIISGRWTRDLLPLLGLKRQPELWGSHGWEQLKPGGEYSVDRFDEAALRALANVDSWGHEIEKRGGRCEHKPGCLAVHWRGLTSERMNRLRNWIEQRWAELPPHPGLGWHDFDGGMELRVLGRDKGDVVASILAEIPAGSPVAYLGDDLTDEDAFRSLQGRGLSVLVRPAHRPTAADVWLKPPAELLAFLDRWHKA